MAYNITKLTTYAMISSLEEDLRAMIKLYIPENQLGSQFTEILTKASNRLEKDIGGRYDEASYNDLVEYLDLGDAIQIIYAHIDLIPQDIKLTLRQNVKSRLFLIFQSFSLMKEKTVQDC